MASGNLLYIYMLYKVNSFCAVLHLFQCEKNAVCVNVWSSVHLLFP